MEKEYRISEKLFSLLWATEGKLGKVWAKSTFEICFPAEPLSLQFL